MYFLAIWLWVLFWEVSSDTLINSLILTSVISNLFSSSILLFSIIVVFIKFYLVLFQIHLFFSLLSCFTVLFLNSFIIFDIHFLLPHSETTLAWIPGILYFLCLALQLSLRILYFFVWLILFIERLFSTGGMCLVL